MSVITTFKSTPELYNFKSDRTFYRVVLQDSIFQMFPYAEVVIHDKTGEIINTAGYTDQLHIDVGLELTNSETKFDKLLHSFFVREQKLNTPDISSFIAPYIEFILTSKYQKDDVVESKSFSGNLSDIISDAMHPTSTKKKFNFDSVRISKTVNVDYFYQPEIGFFDFIQNNIEDAFSSSEYSTSPFISFINLDNQFHFLPLKELASSNIGTPPDFTLIFNDKELFDPKLIRGLSGGYLGLDLTKSNTEIMHIDATMSVVKSEQKIQDMMPSNGTDKFLFRKEDAKVKNSITPYGLDLHPIEFRKGWNNNEYFNSFFPSRLFIKVKYPYLKQIVSGKNINLTVATPFKDKPVSKLFSGQWTILESKHIKDKKDDLTSTLLIGRNNTGVESNHLFFKDY